MEQLRYSHKTAAVRPTAMSLMTLPPSTQSPYTADRSHSQPPGKAAPQPSPTYGHTDDHLPASPTAVQSPARSPTALLPPLPGSAAWYSTSTNSNPSSNNPYRDLHSTTSDRWKGSRAAQWSDPVGGTPPTEAMPPTGHASHKASSFATSKTRQASVFSLKPTTRSNLWSHPSPRSSASAAAATARSSANSDGATTIAGATEGGVHAGHYGDPTLLYETTGWGPASQETAPQVAAATTPATKLPMRGTSPVRQRSSRMPPPPPADYHIPLPSTGRRMFDEMPKRQTTPSYSVIRQVFDEMPEWRTDGFSPAPLAAVSEYTQQVCDFFTDQYYYILYTKPEEVYKFYHDSSRLSRPAPNGTMRSVTTLQRIAEKIRSFHHECMSTEIEVEDVQELPEGEIRIQATGCLVCYDYSTRHFIQSFVLAPQEGGGYFVLSDAFRYVDEHDLWEAMSVPSLFPNATDPGTEVIKLEDSSAPVIRTSRRGTAASASVSRRKILSEEKEKEEAPDASDVRMEANNVEILHTPTRTHNAAERRATVMRPVRKMIEAQSPMDKENLRPSGMESNLQMYTRRSARLISGNKDVELPSSIKSTRKKVAVKIAALTEETGNFTINLPESEMGANMQNPSENADEAGMFLEPHDSQNGGGAKYDTPNAASEVEVPDKRNDGVPISVSDSRTLEEEHAGDSSSKEVVGVPRVLSIENEKDCVMDKNEELKPVVETLDVISGGLHSPYNCEDIQCQQIADTLNMLYDEPFPSVEEMSLSKHIKLELVDGTGMGLKQGDEPSSPKVAEDEGKNISMDHCIAKMDNLSIGDMVLDDNFEVEVENAFHAYQKFEGHTSNSGINEDAEEVPKKIMSAPEVETSIPRHMTVDKLTFWLWYLQENIESILGNGDKRIASAQDAFLRVQSRVLQAGANTDTIVQSRILISLHQIGCLLGQGGSVIAELRKLSGAHIRVFGKDRVLKCSLAIAEVVPIMALSFSPFSGSKDFLLIGIPNFVGNGCLLHIADGPPFMRVMRRPRMAHFQSWQQAKIVAAFKQSNQQASSTMLPAQGQQQSLLSTQRQQFMSQLQSKSAQLQSQMTLQQQQPQSMQLQQGTQRSNTLFQPQGLIEQPTQHLIHSQRGLPAASSTSMDSTTQTGHTSFDWPEEICHQIIWRIVTVVLVAAPYHMDVTAVAATGASDVCGLFPILIKAHAGKIMLYCSSTTLSLKIVSTVGLAIRCRLWALFIYYGRRVEAFGRLEDKAVAERGGLL